MNMNTIDNNMRLAGYTGLDFGTVAAPAEQLKDTSSDTGLSVGTAAPSGLDALNEVDPVVDAALTRTDELGALIDKAFDLAAPPMPQFS